MPGLRRMSLPRMRERMTLATKRKHWRERPRGRTQPHGLAGRKAQPRPAIELDALERLARQRTLVGQVEDLHAVELDPRDLDQLGRTLALFGLRQKARKAARVTT